VVLSAVTDTTVASRAIRAGAFTYLLKPMELQSLLAVVREAAGRDAIANGIILSSVITKNLFRELMRCYAEADTIILIGEKGVGKRAFAKALHLRFHGSEHSILLGDAALLRSSRSLALTSETRIAICIHAYPEDIFENGLNPDLSRFFRKVIIVLEIPPFQRNLEFNLESTMSRKWRTCTIPPLRLRKSEAYPLLCYWYQKLAPEKSLNRHIALERIAELDRSGFPDNVRAVVELARELATARTEGEKTQ
jgi:transcriptional regulator with GAF, ATPase, and Fis domain